MADAPLCLLTVHAHPDDESSKGAGTVARYHDDGVRTVLVCCTGGEAGDILNPAMDREEVRADIAAVRQAELDKAAAIIGYDEVEMLGYRDSGMPDSEANANPECFAQAPFEEAVDRLAVILRRERPQVVVTYGDEQGGYPHPDHLRVHDITQPAIDRAADPGVVARGRRALAGVEGVLLGVGEEAHRAHPRQVPRAGPRVALQRGVAVGDPGRTTASRPRSTSRATRRSASTPCSPTPPRSTRSRPSGSACRARWLAASTPTTTTSAPPASSTPRRLRTTSSPACAPRPEPDGRAPHPGVGRTGRRARRLAARGPGGVRDGAVRGHRCTRRRGRPPPVDRRRPGAGRRAGRPRGSRPRAHRALRPAPGRGAGRPSRRWS